MVISNYSLTGVDNIINNGAKLVTAIRDRALKKAVKRTIDPIHRAALARVSVENGVLKSAIQQKISSKGHKGEAVFGIVGIRRGIKVPVRIVTRGKHKGHLYVQIPTRYAHLVEFGHRIVTSAIWERDPNSKHGRLREIQHSTRGTVVGFAKARPFMRPAWDQYGKEVALKTFLVQLDREITNEVSALAKNP